ncbi:probable serine/threonine-protein kinase dyrk1 isoform X3 [Maniola jurtina]|nr:probable serine/threonine-protein kinase dyrk1 isoform X3 [Maniola jurtina]
MLNKNDTKVTTQRTPTYEEVMNEKIRFRQIEKNLTETLTKLSHVLNQILNIVKYSRYTHFDDIHEFLPTKLRNSLVNRRNYRFKRNLAAVNMFYTKTGEENTNKRAVNNSRDVLPTKLSNIKNQSEMDLDESSNNVHHNIENNNVTKKNAENNLTTINDQENINKTLVNHPNDTVSTKSDIHVDVPVKIGSSSPNQQEERVKRDTTQVKNEVSKNIEVDKKTEVKNKNISPKVETKDTTSETDITKNSRRAVAPIQVTNNEVKNRLFQYIDEAFSEIVKKVDSLKQTKQMFAKDVSYQVGYIISNIDTLKVNMLNMKTDMDKNKYIWDDKKILNLYDTVKVSNQAIADLLEILKNYNIQKSLN